MSCWVCVCLHGVSYVSSRGLFVCRRGDTKEQYVVDCSEFNCERACVCVCVCVRERERESVCVCV